MSELKKKVARIRSKKKDEPHDEVIVSRLTRKQFVRFSEIAERRGMSRGAYSRLAIKERMEQDKDV